jgi:hypothetical protein
MALPGSPACLRCGGCCTVRQSQRVTSNSEQSGSQLMPRGNVRRCRQRGSTNLKQPIDKVGTQIFRVLVGTQIHQAALLLLLLPSCLALVSLLILDECIERKYAKHIEKKRNGNTIRRERVTPNECACIAALLEEADARLRPHQTPLVPRPQHTRPPRRRTCTKSLT